MTAAQPTGEHSALTPRDAPLPTLKPCPFCGCEKFDLTYCNVGTLGAMGPTFYSSIACKDCGAQIYRSGTDAGPAWNRRSALPQQGAGEGGEGVMARPETASAPQVQDAERWPLDHAYFRDAAKRIVAAGESALGKTAGSPEDRRYGAECFTYGAGLARHYLALSPGWLTIDSAPKDGTEVWVFVQGAHGLPSFQCTCAYHPDGGWCADELRHVTRWMPLPEPPK